MQEPIQQQLTPQQRIQQLIQQRQQAQKIQSSQASQVSATVTVSNSQNILPSNSLPNVVTTSSINAPVVNAQVNINNNNQAFIPQPQAFIPQVQPQPFPQPQAFIPQVQPQPQPFSQIQPQPFPQPSPFPQAQPQAYIASVPTQSPPNIITVPVVSVIPLPPQGDCSSQPNTYWTGYRCACRVGYSMSNNVCTASQTTGQVFRPA